MQRAFESFLGVDLGGGKGKTTAVARLRLRDGTLEVLEATTAVDGEPWHDEKLIQYLKLHAEGAVLAVEAPLPPNASRRCPEPVCPSLVPCHNATISSFPLD